MAPIWRSATGVGRPIACRPAAISAWTEAAGLSKGSTRPAKPMRRTDRGKPRRVPAEVAERLIALKIANPTRSVRAIIEKARAEGIDHPLASSTVHRLLAREGLFDRTGPHGGADRRRFAFREAGELWMSDVMHGPKVRHGRVRRKSYLIAFIDDATRVVPFAAFALAENVPAFQHRLAVCLHNCYTLKPTSTPAQAGGGRPPCPR